MNAACNTGSVVCAETGESECTSHLMSQLWQKTLGRCGGQVSECFCVFAPVLRWFNGNMQRAERLHKSETCRHFSGYLTKRRNRGRQKPSK